MRLDESAAGVYVIAATPFLPDGALDLDSTDRMVDFYLEKGFIQKKTPVEELYTNQFIK